MTVRLDEVLEGINLAIKFEISPGLEQDLNGKYLQCKSCGKVFNLGTSFSSPEGVGVSNVNKKNICAFFFKYLTFSF